jgi:2-succinyl-5-enolpyruvyl-6-hydroxy-3-cyclohexene-1-carboxylate synthase
MTEPIPASALAAGVVLDELVQLGLTDLVCCPGSRSAPLAYAGARAEAAGRIRLHMRLDERAAGFTALGLAKATGRAVAVVTTSGTAVANLAPALAEARHAQVPLIALCADRPATLVGTGANQTADQVTLFGSLPLLVVRLAAGERAEAAWRAGVRRAVVTAEGRLTSRPGPVQINLELTEPLLGLAEVAPGGGFRVDTRVGSAPALLPPGPRTVVVAGDLPVGRGRWWANQAARAQVPLLGEPSSNARRGSAAIAAYRYLLGGLSHLVERVVVVGHPTLSRSVTALLSRADLEIVAVDPSGVWSDPGWAVSRVLPAARLPAGDPAWLGLWRAGDDQLRRAMDADPAWSGRALAAAVLGALGPRDPLVLGPSNPVRDADLAPIRARPGPVFAHRGLAGLDGVIATAAGVALGTGRATVALLGDLTALHDIASLALPRLEQVPHLSIVIADDDGGSLFASLEYGRPADQIGALADWFERLFAVPMAVDLGRVADGFGVPVTEVLDAAQLARALVGRQMGLSVIRARLGRQDRAEDDQRWAAAGRHIAAALARSFTGG